MTIVVVTHDENVARRGSRRVNMKDGRLFGGSEAALPAASKARIAASGITAHDLFAEAIAGVIARAGPHGANGAWHRDRHVGVGSHHWPHSNRRQPYHQPVRSTRSHRTFYLGATGNRDRTIDPRAIPWDATGTAGRLNGVVAAGLLSDVNVHDMLVSASPWWIRPIRPHSNWRCAPPRRICSARCAPPRLGTVYRRGHSARAERVAILGPDAARRLGIAGVERLPAIYCRRRALSRDRYPP